MRDACRRCLPSPDQRWPRAAVVVACLLVIIALVPAISSRVVGLFPQSASILSRLPGRAVSAEPPGYLKGIDTAALRRVEGLIEPGSTVFVTSNDPQVNASVVRSALSLYAPAAISVAEPTTARYVLTYGAGTLVPPGLRAGTVRELGPGIALVESRRT